MSDVADGEPVQIGAGETVYGPGFLPKPDVADRYRKALGVKLPEVLALAPAHDPYNLGTDGHLRDAQWFVDIWEQLGRRHGWHLRRLHYAYLSSKDITPVLPDGKPYTGTDVDFDKFCRAATRARYLRMIDPAMIIDRKATTTRRPTISERTEPEIDAAAKIIPLAVPYLPGTVMETETDLRSGYDYSSGEQPVRVELVVEKSTLNDILAPLAADLDLGLIVGEGQVSNTIAYELLARDDGRPLRVLFLSDFDPSGESMPVQLARTLEYEIDNMELPIDAAVHHIALTPDQVHDYRLPIAPIPVKKDSERSRQIRDAWQDRRDFEGRVELDALVVIKPGVLERLIRDTVRPWRDWDLITRWQTARRAAETAVADQWSEHVADIKERLRTINQDAAETYERYREPLERYREELDGLNNTIFDELRPEIAERRASFDPDLPDLPDRPGIESIDETGLATPLFKTGRDYLEQLDEYRRFKDLPEIDEIRPRCLYCGEYTNLNAKWCDWRCSRAYKAEQRSSS